MSTTHNPYNLTHKNWPLMIETIINYSQHKTLQQQTQTLNFHHIIGKFIISKCSLINSFLLINYSVVRHSHVNLMIEILSSDDKTLCCIQCLALYLATIWMYTCALWIYHRVHMDPMSNHLHFHHKVEHCCVLCKLKSWGELQASNDHVCIGREVANIQLNK